MSAPQESVKQKEFAEKHGISPLDIRKFRDKHLDHSEWRKVGVTIYWSKDAADRIESNVFSAPADQPSIPEESTHETTIARVIKQARNPRYVYADLHGRRISVFAGKFAARLNGKTITVRSTEDPEIYNYEP